MTVPDAHYCVDCYTRGGQCHQPWCNRLAQHCTMHADESACREHLCGRTRQAPDEHWTDEPRTEIEYGVNCGDPQQCCDPVHITDDPGTASEWMHIIREPHALRRTVTITYGPWEPINLEDL